MTRLRERGTAGEAQREWEEEREDEEGREKCREVAGRVRRMTFLGTGSPQSAAAVFITMTNEKRLTVEQSRQPAARLECPLRTAIFHTFRLPWLSLVFSSARDGRH